VQQRLLQWLLRWDQQGLVSSGCQRLKWPTWRAPQFLTPQRLQLRMHALPLLAPRPLRLPGLGRQSQLTLRLSLRPQLQIRRHPALRRSLSALSPSKKQHGKMVDSKRTPMPSLQNPASHPRKMACNKRSLLSHLQNRARLPSGTLPEVWLSFVHRCGVLLSLRRPYDCRLLGEAASAAGVCKVPTPRHARRWWPRLQMAAHLPQNAGRQLKDAA